MKYLIFKLSGVIAALSVIVANADSASFINKPEVPTELKK